jgi:chaperonin GroEL (HSP60 family)
MTAMTGKGAENSKEKFAEIVVKAIKQVQNNGKVDFENIKIEKSRGEGIEDTELIQGIVLDKEKISGDMPSVVNNAKIVLIDFPLELKNPEIDTKISVSSPDQLQGFLNQEERLIKEMVNKVRSTNANVIFCQKGVDEFAQYLFSKSGVYVCRRVSKSDMEKLAKATGGKIVSNINELSPSELGEADIVEEVKHGEDTFTYVRGCRNPKAVTILIHGGTDHLIDEIERAIKDGFGVVASSLKTKLVVPGGGAIDIELARRLRHFGQSLSGREQLAVEEFASALEFIPTTLAENAGLDPIDILTELKSRHDAGDRNVGLNLFNNKIENVLEARIIEPFKIKSQAINSASEVANMILRIDDVIAANGKNKSGMRIHPEANEEF